MFLHDKRRRKIFLVCCFLGIACVTISYRELSLDDPSGSQDPVGVDDARKRSPSPDEDPTQTDPGETRPNFPPPRPHYLSSSHNNNTSQQPASSKGLKTILFYNSLFGDETFNFGLGREPFLLHNCPQSNCHASSRRNDGNANLSSFDAIVFHAREPDNKYLPDQTGRRAAQRYVMYLNESPANDNALVPYKLYNNIFNWTMTYRHDSDIPAPYGWIEPRDAPYLYPPSLADLKPWPPFNRAAFVRTLPSRSAGFSALARRPGMVAWVVSNCFTLSQREQYVAQLRKHVGVDTMGSCGGGGTVSCGPGHPNPPSSSSSSAADNCSAAVEARYKFYLSFENSFCNEYVTEKFFRRMAQDVIPVVFGQADYSAIAPPHSYINALDFATPKDLAEFLVKLAADEEEYLSYFWWKDGFVSRWGREHLNRGMCRLCEMLHREDLPEKQAYDNVKEWWVRGAECAKSGKFPWSTGGGTRALSKHLLQFAVGALG